jgi:N-acetylmuramoyl-L-alanine amidase
MLPRLRLFVPLVSLAAALVAGPILASIALASDPIVVRPGETLTGIAKRHGVSIARLVELNDIRDPNRIYAGQRLRVTSGRSAPTAAPPPAARSHTVRSGENLTVIARRYGVSVAAIVSANGIANPSRIYAGQRLRIPGSASPAAAPPSTTPASMAALMERRDKVRRIIVEEAKRYKVPAALALAVAWQESGWQQGVVSRAGAIGVMQIMPATGAWIGEAMLGTRVNLHDTRQNVRAGVRLLAHYIDRYAGNVDLVLAAYYQGQTAADRHGVYPVSRPYVASIKALVRMLGG